MELSDEQRKLMAEAHEHAVKAQNAFRAARMSSNDRGVEDVARALSLAIEWLNTYRSK